LHAVCSVAYEEDFVDEACGVGCEGGPEQFSGVIGVEEWYMRDSIDRKDSGGGRGIYCVVDVIIVGHDGFVDLVGVLVVKWEVKNLHAGVLDEVLVRQ
jgi:hypothetical protein